MTLGSSLFTNTDFLTKVQLIFSILLFILHSMLHSIDLIKSLKAKGLPSAEAEFGLSKDLRHGMSDEFIEKYITVANKQSLGR